MFELVIPNKAAIEETFSNIADLPERALDIRQAALDMATDARKARSLSAELNEKARRVKAFRKAAHERIFGGIEAACKKTEGILTDAASECRARFPTARKTKTADKAARTILEIDAPADALADLLAELDKRGIKYKATNC